MAKKTNAAVAVLDNEALEVLTAFFEDHSADLNTILEDYVAGPAMTAEVNNAVQNLKKSIYSQIEVLQNIMRLREERIEELENDITSKDEELEKKEKKIEELEGKVEDLEDAAEETEGAVVIQLSNIVLRDKLENFIHTEIYPNYLDQQSYVTI